MQSEENILLIGPMSAGKSTVAKELSKKLGLQRVELDELRWDYFAEIDYDEDHVRAIMQEGGGGYAEMFAYWKPFELHALERVLEDYQSAVIDFGAGYTVQDDPALYKRVEAALKSQEQVFLLLPTQDKEESIKILNERLERLLLKELGEVNQEALELNKFFVTHPSNQQLATHVVYTLGKSAIQTTEEIISHLKSN